MSRFLRQCVSTLATVISLTACSTVPTRVVIGAGNQAPLHNLFQQWLLIDDRQPLRELRGTIEEVHLNRGVLFSDGDWNVIVRPDPEYRGLLVNRARVENADGAIELEIRSAWPEQGLDLSKEFPPGSRIRASGWWVEDSGHANKTELHPLVAMQTLDRPSIVFVGQDLTGRFAVARTGLDTIIELPFAPVPAMRNLTSGETVPGHADALVESARGDFGSHLTSHGQALAIHLEAVDDTLRAAGGLPYYLAHFDQATAPNLVDQVGITKESTTDGHPYLQVTVTAALDSSPGSPPWESQGWSVGDVESEGRQLSTILKYAPGLGFINHEWTIEGYAATSYSWSPALQRSRTIVRAPARYIIETSAVALSAARTDQGFSVTAVVRKAYPLLECVLFWQVTTNKHGPIPVPEGSVVQVDGISFKATTEGALDIQYPPGKRDPVRISLSGGTDIGELLRSDLGLPAE